MNLPHLVATLLFVGSFGLGAWLDIWFQGWTGNRAQSSDLLTVMLGDSRRMFANHFFIKADAYFHSGFYPTIYDNREAFQTPHMAEDAGAMEGKNKGDEDNFLGHPLDWIDHFGRHCFPSHHTHLDQGGSHEGNAAAEKGQEREILPWLRFSAQLDPQRVETYMVAAYWLRERMGKAREAEEFLRDGLRANPESYEILFELGRIYAENHKDDARARNLWELAHRRWLEQEPAKKEPNTFLFIQITSHLALLEERQGRQPQALAWMELWKKHSPYPEEVQKRIDELKGKLPTTPANR